MVPIKSIAGEILIELYKYQRSNGGYLSQLLRFTGLGRGALQLENGALDIIDFLKFGSVADIFNALQYLFEKKFISFTEYKTPMSIGLHMFKVTADGIDIIEGIERGSEEKQNFNLIFNIKLADNVTIDSLIKTDLKGLIGM